MLIFSILTLSALNFHEFVSRDTLCGKIVPLHTPLGSIPGASIKYVQEKAPEDFFQDPKENSEDPNSIKSLSDTSNSDHYIEKPDLLGNRIVFPRSVRRTRNSVSGQSTAAAEEQKLRVMVKVCRLCKRSLTF